MRIADIWPPLTCFDLIIRWQDIGPGQIQLSIQGFVALLTSGLFGLHPLI